MSDTFLKPPFETLERQHQAVSFGMWVFLVSEVLLFAGLFAGYSVYRNLYPEGFLVAGRAARAHVGRTARRLLIATMTLGLTFLILKGFEYREDIAKHLLPGPSFALAQPGAEIFFSYYWVMTGIHATHVTGGLIAVGRLIIASRRDATWLSGSASEDATAVYWHLVDVIWVVLYPLLYLTGRTGHG
jgi:cytochrome c oxidase subunit 3